MDKIYCDFYTKCSSLDEETPCLKYAARDESGEWKKFQFSYLEGTFTGAWHGTKKWKEEETPTYNINITVGGKEHIIQLKHFKPGYDFINLMSNFDPNDTVRIELSKTQDKNQKWWPSIKIWKVNGTATKQATPVVDYRTYPRAVMVVNNGRAVKGKDGKDVFDFTVVKEFWDSVFEKIINKFPKFNSQPQQYEYKPNDYKAVVQEELPLHEGLKSIMEKAKEKPVNDDDELDLPF